MFWFSALWDPKCLQVYIYIYTTATSFDLVGHPQALQEYRSKLCFGFLHYGIQNAYKLLIYARATCFYLVGHPQALQEYRSKRCLGFLNYGIQNAYKLQLVSILDPIMQKT